jgi:hypothetical protein
LAQAMVLVHAMLHLKAVSVFSDKCDICSMSFYFVYKWLLLFVLLKVATLAVA